MDESLHKKLVEDLRKSGFRSEMMVLRSLLEHRWHMVGGDTYRDEDENRLREVDASAFLQRWGQGPGGDTELMVFVFLAIEVKRAEAP